MRSGSDRSAAALAKRSFPPVVDGRAHVLVLGTLPGEESLRRGEYYAHPRNLFWPIIFALFGEAPASNYAERLAFLTAHRIAVWDVCELGERERSVDTTIRLERPNAIDRLLDDHPLIRAVAFNGTTARLVLKPVRRRASDMSSSSISMLVRIASSRGVRFS